MKSEIRQSLEVRDLYRELNKRRGESRWDFMNYAEGMIGDTGDLMKLLMAKSGLRSIEGDLDQKIAHELSDIIWSTLIIADELGIDIETKYRENIEELKRNILTKLEK